MEFYEKESNYYFQTKDTDGYNVSIYLNEKSELQLSHNCFTNVDTCILFALYMLEKENCRDDWRLIQLKNVNTTVKEYHNYDSLVEDAWKTLCDVNIDEDECIEQSWFIFPKGTYREDIWHWFDEHHSKGVGWIMAHVYE